MIITAIKSWNSAAKAIGGIWAADSLRGRFARGAVWSLIGAVIAQGANLAASVITARLLGRDHFGEYGMIQSTVGMFGVFAGMGLGLTATKYVAELRMTNPERTGRIICLTTTVTFGTAAITMAAVFAAAPWLAANTLNAPHLSAVLRIALGVLFLNALNGTQTGVLAGLEAFRTIARVNLTRGVLSFPLSVAGVFLWGLPGAVGALVAAAVIGAMLNHVAIRAECRRNNVPVHYEGSWSDHGILWKFSLPTFLASATTSSALWAANSILVNQPHGYAEMGLYNAARHWRVAVAFLPSLLSLPLLPLLSNVGTGDPKSFRTLLRANVLLSLGLSILVAGPIVICSPWIMNAYGRDFLAGWPVLVLLILATVISSTAAVIGQAIASLDRMWWGFSLNSVWSFVLLASASLLVPRYGALGLAWAFLLAYLVHALTVSTYVHVNLKKHLVHFAPSVCGSGDALLRGK